MKTTRRKILSFAAIGALGAWPARAETASQPDDALAKSNQADFDQVWELVRDRFYDPHLNGLDWQEERGRFRPQAASARSREEAAVVINAMLGKLNASHTHYYTPEDPAYYQLADIFAGGLEHRGLDRLFPRGEVSYPGIGVFTERDAQGRAFATGVIEGAPAHAAGLLVGDEILSADDRPFRAVESFRGKVGAPVSLQIRRASGAAPITISVSPADLHPNEMFLRGLKDSARIIASEKAKIGYVHVWSYASRRIQSALEDLMSDGPLKDADALVFDLRGGWGGAQPQYLDLFNPHAPTMQVKDRNGETGLVDVKWRKPVAMLINEGTRSGKEVLAYGFKQYHLGELIGHRTEGAVLAATAFLIGDDGLLLLAVEDVLVDGQRLEGVGVTPTIEVPFDWRYAAGGDPQLDRAVQVLARA
ncbi:MAG: PDZ domain-containing protein [Hyphomicrobiales bacterium]|nr:PDZ domain-containing protein [Hyphomicrobiales bacterium]